MSKDRVLGAGCSPFCFVAVVSVGVGLIRAADPVASAGPYKVLNTFNVGGDGGWDYLALDPVTNRLFVTRSTHVMVLDADTGKSVGDIPDTAGVHGVALVSDLGRGFTSNGKANSVAIFDLKTLKPISTVKVGENPDAIVFEPTTKRVFSMNPGSKDATAIDAATGQVVGTIALGGEAEYSVADGAGKLYVNIEDTNEVLQLDPKELKVVSRWSLAPGEEPSGLAIDVKNHRLFSVCSNKMMVVLDSESGKVIATPAIGEDPDGAAFDPSTDMAFSSNKDGTLTVIHEESPSTFTVIQNLPTQKSARTMTLDPKSHRLFLPAARFSEPPPATKEHPHPRAPMAPGSFQIIVVGK